MSHAPGQVLDADRVLGWFEYSETVDTARPQIFASREDLEAHWRSPQAPACLCEGQPVRLSVGERTWSARACFEHRCLVAGLSSIDHAAEDDVRRPMSEDKPQTVAEFMRRAREAGHDALGIAEDPEAQATFAKIRDPLDPTRKFSEGGAHEHRAALMIGCPSCGALPRRWCPLPGTTWNLCGARIEAARGRPRDPG